MTKSTQPLLTTNDILLANGGINYDVITSIIEDIDNQGIQYQLTDGELKWLDMVKGKYSIASYIEENLSGNLLTLDNRDALSLAMEEDSEGSGKAVMLSDDTALQSILFHAFQHPEMADDIAER